MTGKIAELRNKIKGIEYKDEENLLISKRVEKMKELSLKNNNVDVWTKCNNVLITVDGNSDLEGVLSQYRKDLDVVQREEDKQERERISSLDEKFKDEVVEISSPARWKKYSDDLYQETGSSKDLFYMKLWARMMQHEMKNNDNKLSREIVNGTEKELLGYVSKRMGYEKHNSSEAVLIAGWKYGEEFGVIIGVSSSKIKEMRSGDLNTNKNSNSSSDFFNDFYGRGF